MGLHSGRKAQELGRGFITDRNCSHKSYQDMILRQEHERWGKHFDGLEPRNIKKELTEYREADLITVPSEFSLRTFLEQGVDPKKLRKVPYGVNLSLFTPVGKPPDDSFNVLYVGGVNLRKGSHDLLNAFEKLDHPKKSLTLIGGVSPEMASPLKIAKIKSNIIELGTVSQVELKKHYSTAHVFVLPSIEDGFGMVMGEAMACGCPVICTTNTGAHDIVDEGINGFVVPIRDPDAITDRMQLLANSPDLRANMSQAALEKVKNLGGWNDYGDRIAEVIRELS
jgi:glycosyltransferase involved in cell wall biosynthesis